MGLAQVAEQKEHLLPLLSGWFSLPPSLVDAAALGGAAWEGAWSVLQLLPGSCPGVGVSCWVYFVCLSECL